MTQNATFLADSFSVDDVRAAATRIAGRVRETPLLENDELNRRAGARILLKAEVLQHTGSFKARGAFNKLLSIPASERKRGVVAFSSGNHAQAVAFAARSLDIPAVIVMPFDAPAVKLQRTREFGAEVVTYDRDKEDRAAIATRLVSERGATLVPPFDDAFVMAGQGTAGLEMSRQAKALDAQLDIVLAPASGGGLVGGLATAFAAESPSTRVMAVEPDGFDDLRRSIESGKLERNSRSSGSVCDALLVMTPGELTFAVNRKRLAGVVSVSDEEALRATAFAFDNLRLVVEPSGAVGLAAILSGKVPCKGKTIGIILSGGNIDRSVLARALGE